MASSQSTSPGSTGPEKSNSPMPSSGRSSNQDINSLVSHLRSIEGVDDDIAQRIAENWQRMLGFMVVILLGVWLVSNYRAQQVSKSEDASNLFVEAQNAYRTAKAGDAEVQGEKSEDGLARVDAKLRMVSESYPDSVYTDLAPLYRGLADSKAGKGERALTELQGFAENFRKSARYFPGSGELSKDRFVNELGAFVFAKTLLATPDRGDDAVALLKELARNSALVAPEAAVTLLRIAEGDGQLTEAVAIARELAEARPELAAILARELKPGELESGGTARAPDEQ